MRLTASSATGEISLAGLPLRTLPGDVGQFEELAPGVAPAQRAGHRPRSAISPVEVVVAAIGIGLQDAPPAREMPIGVGLLPVAGEEEQRGRRCAAGEGAVVADIGPEPRGPRPAPGQQRHGRVVAVQAVGRQHMLRDQGMERLQRDGGMADLVGQGGQAEIDALARVALGLPVQRLVLAELLEEPPWRAGWGPPIRAGWRGTAPAAG